MINVIDLDICEASSDEELMLSRFAAEVRKGLLAFPKRISSQWLYDRRGSELFERITRLDEYYPTARETWILRERAAEIAALIPEEFEMVVELGAGDGRKTAPLLRALLDIKTDFIYSPVDVSRSALEELGTVVARELGPEAQSRILRPMLGENLEVLGSLPRSSERAWRFVLFLGSSVGNLSRADLGRFLDDLRRTLRPGDRVLLGFDLVKDPDRLKRAYSDSAGVTREFNLNLLDRMNRELGADFDRCFFRHEAIWNPAIEGLESWLIAEKDQVVTIPSCGRRFHFRKWEGFLTEISLKFREETLPELASAHGFRTIRHFADPSGDFVDAVWEVSGGIKKSPLF